MTIKFAIMDPITHEYVYETNRDLAIDRITNNAVDTYINQYCGGVVCSLVEPQDDGTEKWYTQEGLPTPSPNEIRMRVLILMRSRVPVENIPLIPVTKL